MFVDIYYFTVIRIGYSWMTIVATFLCNSKYSRHNNNCVLCTWLLEMIFHVSSDNTRDDNSKTLMGAGRVKCCINDTI